MADSGGGLRQGLVECAATADAFLRALSAIQDEAELRQLLDAIANELGFRHYALIHHDDLRGDPRHRVKLLDYPTAVENRIIAEGAWRRDPVVRACCFMPRAFSWSEVSTVLQLSRHDRACFEFGSAHRLNDGVTVPFHLLGECMGSCTFAGTRASGLAERRIGIAQMVGVFAFQAARRCLGIGPLAPRPPPRLHPRPRECIVLVGRGYSNKEIARALALAPRTVDGYLTEAREAFGANDRTELVMCAMFAGEVGIHEVLEGAIGPILTSTT